MRGLLGINLVLHIWYGLPHFVWTICVSLQFREMPDFCFCSNHTAFPMELKMKIRGLIGINLILHIWHAQHHFVWMVCIGTFKKEQTFFFRNAVSNTETTLSRLLLQMTDFGQSAGYLNNTK
jgi:hypothetical protein